MIIIPVLRAIEKLKTGPLPALEMPGSAFFDRRKQAAQKHHGHPTRTRTIKSVTAITLHQTGCWMGERPGRYDGMGAHVGVTREGRVIWLHDWDRRVIAANGLNDSTVSIEFDGLYRGVKDRPDTVWDNPATAQRETGMDLTGEAVAAGLDCIRWIVADVARRGGRILALRAHREASAARRSDPGEAVWRRVALVAAADLGLETGGAVLGDGRAIPKEWDERSTAKY